ncbi:MAG: gliding motility-associated C-terminal domain-containing protein [Bacteroidia bacterium]
MRNTLLVVFLFLVASSSSFGQIDQEFWFGAPDLTQGTPGEFNSGNYRDRPIQLVISTLVDPAQVTIWQPANLSFQPIVINIAASATQTVNLTNWINQIETSIVDSVLNRGILIRSTAPITAYYELGAAANRDIIALKGKNATGNLFFTPFQNIWENDQSLGGNAYFPPPRTGFVIVATDDSTTVTITPSIDILNHQAGVPFDVFMNRGQTYYCEALDQQGPSKPAGTKIQSDRPICVTIKDDMIDLNLATDGGADLAGDQLISAEQCGFKHIVVRGDLGNPGDKVYILATEDSTEIFIDGNPIAVDTLNTGEQYIYSFTDAAGFIEGSKPVYVLHISGVTDQIAGAVIPSLECTGSNQVGFTRTGNANFKLNLTIRAGFENQFELNGTSTFITPADFQPVPGSNGEWVYMRKSFSTAEIPVGQGSLLTNFSEELFHMGITYQQGASCNFGYFTNFSYLELGINQELCLGDTALLDAGPGKTSYLWSTGDTTQKIVVTTPGTYYVTTLSGNECSATDTVSVNYYEPPVSILAARDTICEGASLLLNVPGVYLFEWQDGSTDPFYIASDSGLYYVEVTDFQGCKARDSINIYTSPRPETPEALIRPLPATVTADTVCAGDEIILEMNALADASYAWLGPNNTLYTGQTISIDPINVNQSGNYLAFFTVAGCESFFDSLTITVNPSPEVYIGLTDTICDTQTAQLDAGTGSGYVYEWQDGSVDQEFTVSESGLYWVEVTNTFGCSERDSVDLFFSLRPEIPELSIAGVIAEADSLCEGETLTLQVPALSGASYFWVSPNDTVQTNGNQYSQNNILVDQSGNYYAYYRLNGCPSFTDSVSIVVQESPDFQFAFSDSSLCGDGEVLLSALTPDVVNYQWQDNSNGSTYLVTESGEYWVKLENEIGCSLADTVNVTFNPLPETPVISGDLSVCDGNDLILNSNAQTGVNYSWGGPGVNTSGNTLTIPTANESQEGEYSLSAELNGCKSDTVFAQIIVNENPTLDLGADLAVCLESETTITGPAGFSSYNWSTGEETESISAGSGNYILSVTDDNGCEAEDDINVAVSGPTADFSSNPTTGTQVDVLIAFTDESTGNPSIWDWNFGDNTSSATQNTNHAFTAQGEYTVTLTVTDENGCSDSESRVYTISNSVAVPNSFTPNGDGFNDFFAIQGLDAFPDSKLTIFNRWGTEIYSVNAYANNWDAVDSPDGTYFYILELTNGEKINGDVTIIRK